MSRCEGWRIGNEWLVSCYISLTRLHHQASFTILFLRPSLFFCVSMPLAPVFIYRHSWTFFVLPVLLQDGKILKVIEDLYEGCEVGMNIPQKETKVKTLSSAGGEAPGCAETENICLQGHSYFHHKHSTELLNVGMSNSYGDDLQEKRICGTGDDDDFVYLCHESLLLFKSLVHDSKLNFVIFFISSCVLDIDVLYFLIVRLNSFNI